MKIGSFVLDRVNICDFVLDRRHDMTFTVAGGDIDGKRVTQIDALTLGDLDPQTLLQVEMPE